ncbi:MAG: hypothetical protein ACREV9_18050, partial [Burkholderiales bacterium]
MIKAATEIDALHGKYKHVWPEIEKFERLLAANYNHGHQRVPGLHLTRDCEPASIWKARVLHPRLGGKRSGLRYVYERLWIGDEEYAVALTAYVHQEGAKESEIIARIRERFDWIETTP